MTPPTTESSSTEGPDRAENDLEKLFFRAGNDPAARPAFYRLLMDSVIFSLVEANAPVDEQGNYTGSGERIGFIILNDSRGAYVPVFTSTKRLAETVGDSELSVKHVGMVGAWMFGVLKFLGHSVVLNPSGPTWRLFSPQEVSDLAAGRAFEPTVRYLHMENLIFLTPESIPAGLVEALTRYFLNTRAVSEAYLASMADSSVASAPSLVLALRGESDLSQVVKDVGVIGHELGPPGDQGLDIIVLGVNDPLDARVSSTVVPFYQRRGA